MMRPCALLLILALSTDAAQTSISGSITGSALMDERVDLSIERGLAYLASIQRKDGGFDTDTTGIAGLCGMTFLAKGYLPGDDKYGGNIDRVIDYILANTNDKGIFGKTTGGYMYSHGICTLFLTEVSGMVDEVRQEKIDEVLPKAVQVILTSQGDQGGWAYAALKGDHDLSISGWQLMSLRSARLNGAPVPSESIKRAVKYVLKRNDAKKGTFGYMDTHSHSVTLTGAGILCLELCGEHGNPVIDRAGNYLMGVYEKLPKDPHAVYGLYYTAQGLFQLGGIRWERFSKWMYDYWIPLQNKNGSFAIGEGKLADSEVTYKTAMTVLAFSVPYRLLPIYQRDETVDESE
jgi:prenyltransferase beta subunit